MTCWFCLIYFCLWVGEDFVFNWASFHSFLFLYLRIEIIVTLTRWRTGVEYFFRLKRAWKRMSQVIPCNGRWYHANNVEHNEKFSRIELLKIVNISNRKCSVFDNLQNKEIESVWFLIEPSLKYCVLRGSFSEMFDNLAIITTFESLRTPARTDGSTI